MNLEIDTATDNFIKVKHRKINESIDNIVVGDDFVSKQNGVSNAFSITLTYSGDSNRSEDIY